MTPRHSLRRSARRRGLAITVAIAPGAGAARARSARRPRRSPSTSRHPPTPPFRRSKIEITEVRIGANREELDPRELSRRSALRQEAGSFYIASRIDRIAAAKERKAIEVPPAVKAMVGSEIVRVFRHRRRAAAHHRLRATGGEGAAQDDR